MSCGCSKNLNSNLISKDTLDKTNKHPCYSFDAHHKYARMHLPVAPKCNISCNYCNRKFDCVNESRPGVTSEVLTPEMARDKFIYVKSKITHLSVVGIAGPGDALANWEDTKKSIQLIKESDPDIVFCLSTNGLMLPDYAQEIIDLGIKHVTVTVNSLELETAAKIYKFVYYKGQKYTGTAGADILIKNQLAGIKYLAENGVLVKVNIVLVKGINDHGIPDVVKKVKELGAFITNIMPLIPAPGSAFESFPQTSMKEVNKMRKLCEVDLQQMYHCKQCRADAIGLLADDRSWEFRLVNENELSIQSDTKRVQYKIAVASKSGKLIDQHFGQASEFTIFQGNGEVFQLIEKRPVKKYCNGPDVCDYEKSNKEKLINLINDCDAVLTSRIGNQPKESLSKYGTLSVETCDTIENALKYAVNKITNKEIMQ